MIENKGDLISREALKENCVSCFSEWCSKESRHCETCSSAIVTREMIDNAPTIFNCNTCKNMGNERECVDCHDYSNYVHYEKRPQGEWIMITEYDGFIHAKCSVCNQFNDWGDVPFCPWCGADMRPKPNQLRDCENCIHHSENGCEVWGCEFEKRSDL